MNFSIRVSPNEAGTIRHLGWEDPFAKRFTANYDMNGILWEHFNQQQQQDEIQTAWPEVEI